MNRVKRITYEERSGPGIIHEDNVQEVFEMRVPGQDLRMVFHRSCNNQGVSNPAGLHLAPMFPPSRAMLMSIGTIRLRC